ncbi:MAG: RNA-binding protein [Dehalococcoidia bacterium]|nr:RNA-binding protein [Dehalococcoidia bacterium]
MNTTTLPPRRNLPRQQQSEGDVRELILYIARSLADHPDSVEVKERRVPRAIILELRVHSDDKGKVIGKEGRIARAIRTLLGVPANRQRQRVILEIV